MKTVKSKNLKKSFATCINCMDGRVQEPSIRFLKKKFSVKYIDMITEPGADKILAQYQAKATIAAIKKKVQISIEKHNSKAIAIVGHHDCAGNPVSDTTHLRQIKKAVKNISQWKLGVPVWGVWIDRHFRVEKVLSLK